MIEYAFGVAHPPWRNSCDHRLWESLEQLSDIRTWWVLSRTKRRLAKADRRYDQLWKDMRATHDCGAAALRPSCAAGSLACRLL